VVEAASGADSMELMSQAAYARRRKCSAQHINNLIGEGRIPSYGPKKKVNPREADEILNKTRDLSREGVRQSNAARYGKSYVPPPMAAPQSRSQITLSPEQQAALGFVGKEDKNEIPDFAKSKAEREFLAVQRERIELARETKLVVETDIAVQIAGDTGRKWLEELRKVQMQVPIEVRDLAAKSFDGLNQDQLDLFKHEVRQLIEKAHRDAVDVVIAMLDGMAKNLEAPPN
jgi:hypothetical protein